MSHIDRNLVETFLTAVDSKLVPQIEARRDRLMQNAKLLNKYRSECGAWRSRRVPHVRGITEVVNELCFADLILKDEKVRTAEYEPPIGNTKKTIDFLVVLENSGVPCTRIYYDVKTIQPEERNSWERYERTKVKGLFTSGTELVLDPEWMGGEIAHDFFVAREKFLEYTLEFEDKIRHIKNRESCRFEMVFCGDGFQWRCDHLEDFADFYFTGRHRHDDPFGDMEAFDLAEKRIALDRTINGFCYLQRTKPRVTVTKFKRNVRGPLLFSP